MRCNFCAKLQSFQRDRKYLWLQHFRLMNIFYHVGKPAVIAQKLQHAACNRLHVKPRHYFFNIWRHLLYVHLRLRTAWILCDLWVRVSCRVLWAPEAYRPIAAIIIIIIIKFFNKKLSNATSHNGEENGVQIIANNNVYTKLLSRNAVRSDR